MKRREFLRRIVAAPVAAAAAPLIATALSRRQLAEDRISLRFIQAYDAAKDVTRYDILFGMSVHQPQWACRVSA